VNECDAPLHAANRAARRAARVLVNTLETDRGKNPDCAIDHMYPELTAVAEAFEKAEREAMKEATR
jgi:hypothetical protein